MNVYVCMSVGIGGFSFEIMHYVQLLTYIDNFREDRQGDKTWREKEE